MVYSFDNDTFKFRFIHNTHIILFRCYGTLVSLLFLKDNITYTPEFYYSRPKIIKYGGKVNIETADYILS